MTDDTPAAPPPAKRGIAYIFTGPEGLRAGWSLLLFVAIVLLLALGLRWLHPAPKASPGSASIESVGVAISEAVVFLILLVSAFIVSLVERRPFASYGLRAARMLPDFLKEITVTRAKTPK